MTSKPASGSTMRSVLIILFAALLVQLIGRYHAGELILGGSFYLSWVVLRIAVPVAVLLALKIPLSRIGLGMPKIDRTTGKIIILVVIVLLGAFGLIYFFDSYFGYYTGAFQAGDRAGRFASFGLFTASTLTGWEFLHRGFILMGVLYILSEREGLGVPVSSTAALGIVWVFEVVFHFLKPELEAFGMLIGSPFLSWLALRTRSIWVPFLIHLFVELLFIASLIMR